MSSRWRRAGFFLLSVGTILTVFGLLRFFGDRAEERSRTFQRLVDSRAMAEQFEAELGPPDALEERQTEFCWRYSKPKDLYATVCFSRETGKITTWGQIWE